MLCYAGLSWAELSWGLGVCWLSRRGPEWSVLVWFDADRSYSQSGESLSVGGRTAGSNEVMRWVR